jgi:flagellar biosynthesis/type III secretory pathway ATPase
VIEPQAEGRITRSVGLTLEAVGLNVSVGRQCEIINNDGRHIEAEVVGFSGDKVFLMPIKRVDGLQPGARVIPVANRMAMRIGPQLLGVLSTVSVSHWIVKAHCKAMSTWILLRVKSIRSCVIPSVKPWM